MRLKQIFINLISNALKFTRNGEIVISINLLEYQQMNSLNSVSLRVDNKDKTTEEK
jgi:signal transduction histidine kinase